MSSLSAKVLFITGGTGSVGSEIVRQALAAGWRVVFQGRSESRVKALLEQLYVSYDEHTVAAIVIDIKQPGAVEEMVQSASAVFGQLDAVVDCLVTGPEDGGITGAFEATSPHQYAPFMAYSIVYLQRFLHAVLPILKRRDKSCFVSFVSDAGLFPASRQSLIASARAAAIAFLKNVAIEVAKEGVRVHAISLSFVAQSDIANRLVRSSPERLAKASQRAGLGLPTPADIAPAALFLCSDGASCMTGQILCINGGINV